MNTNKTLADVQPGGRVRLGDQLPPLPYPNYPVSKTGLQNNAYTASQMWDYARAALSAQPSPSGQDAPRNVDDKAVRQFLADRAPTDVHREEILSGAYDRTLWFDHIRELMTALAARQPVSLIAQKIGDYRVTVAEDAITVSRGRDIVFAYSAGDPEPIMDRQPVGESVAKSVGIDALVRLLEDEAAECEKAWTERADTYMSGRASGFLLAADYFRKIATSQRWSEFLSSPAQAVDLERARDEGHDAAIRYVLGYLNGVGDCGSTAYDEILNACGRERIIRSAVEDGELDFTGLGRWVEMYGSADDRALIDGKAVGNGQSVGMADLEQILLDPENQPSQFGTVPTELLEKCEEMISDLVHQFGDRGCTCTFPEADCCAYARAEHYSRDGAAHG